MKLSEPKPSHLWQDVKFGLSEAVVVIINARPNLYSAGTRISQPARGGRPEGGGRYANLLFGKVFAENCMEMKEIWPV